MTWDWPHLVYLRKQLLRVTHGEVDRIAIALPAQHAKTRGTLIPYGAWRMLREDNLRVAIGSHTQRYADKISKFVRRMVVRAGGVLADNKRADEWNLTNGSTFIARGVGASISGESVDLFLMDDVFGSREDADSVSVQEKVYEWYMDDVTPRLQKNAALVMTNTRWNPGDLIGRIQQSEEWPEWVYVRIPAIAETQETRDQNNASQGLPIGLPDPIGREPGRELCADRFPLDKLLQKQRIEGVGFESVYQQNPIPRGGTFFERRWLLGGDGRPLVKSLAELPLMLPMQYGRRLVRYWDLASSRNDSACYTSGVLLMKLGDGETAEFWVCDVVRGRWMPAERNEKMREVADRDAQLYGFEKTWFESPVFDKNKAAARAIYAALSGHPVSADNVSGSGSKELRAEPVAGAAKGGLLKVVDGGWVPAFLTEVESFPRSTYKDQCIPGDAPVWCRRGQIPIANVTTDDEVMTRSGWRRVLESAMTSVAADTIAIGHIDGGFLECTHTHPVFVVGRGFVAAADVRVGDEVLTCPLKSMWSFGTGRTGAGIRRPASGTDGGTTRATTTAFSRRFIAPSGSTPTDRFLTATKSITRTATPSTTNWTTSSYLPSPNTGAARAIWVRSTPALFAPTLIEFGPLLPLGTRPKREGSGTARTGASCSPSGPFTSWFASGARPISSPSFLTPCSVETSAENFPVRPEISFTSSYAGSASGNSKPIARRPSIAPTRVAGLRDMRRGVPVYNLRVEGDPEFFAGGVLVHNCDSLSGAYNRLSRGGFAIAVS